MVILKKEKTEKESTLKKKIKEMKKTPKGVAILKLIGWGIFFFVIFVFCMIASLINPPKKIENEKIDNPPTNQEEQNTVIDKEQEYIRLLENLKTSNYDYEYKITINEETYIFNGSKENNIEKGYKESSIGIIKYYIDETGIYEELTTNKTPITNLYENISVSYLNLDYIISNLKDKVFINIETADFSYPTYYVKDEKNIYYISYKNTIGEENNQVEGITIKSLDNTYTYELTYKNVR